MRHLDWNLDNDLKGKSMLLVVAAKDFLSEVNVDELRPRWCEW